MIHINFPIGHEALHELGYGVLESGNADDALAILDREAGVRVLFTDVVMPDTNGKEAGR